MSILTIRTPVGPLTLAASADGLTRATFGPLCTRPAPGDDRAAHWLELARDELGAYFVAALREFTVPVDLRRVPSPRRRILDELRGASGTARPSRTGSSPRPQA